MLKTPTGRQVVKVQRLAAAVSLALVLMASAPMARAGGMDDPIESPHSVVAAIGECLSQAALLGLDIVSSAL